MNFINNFISSISVNEKKIIYLIYFLPISLLAGSLIINLAVTFVGVFFILEILKENKLKKIFNVYTFFFIVISIYLILNSIFISENSKSVIKAISFLRFAIFATAIAYYFKIEDSKYEKKILTVWFSIFLIVTVDLLFEFIFGFNTLNFKSSYQGRLAGFTGDELKIGGYYFGFFLLSVLIINNNQKYFILFFIIFLVTSYLIGERSNFIKVFFIGIIFYFFVLKMNNLKKIFFLIFPMLVILLITSSNETYKQRFYVYIIKPVIEKNIDLKSSKDKHISHYRLAIDMFNNNKIFGVGFKNFRNESFHRQVNLGENIAVTTHPHQIHFEFLSELGIIGYLIMISFLFFTIFDGFKIYKFKKSKISLAATLFILATILPIIPSGSFFTTYGATIFWINFSFILKDKLKFNK
tara:strand:- start:232 stop:1461 length:1230 start_codon:yes stop_codon:yes gene_type:complete